MAGPVAPQSGETARPDRRDRSKGKASTYLRDTRVVRLDVRVIAEVSICYSNIRTAKDHRVERIQCLETERETHAFPDVDLFLEKRVELEKGWISDTRQVTWGIAEGICPGLGKCSRV